VEYEKEDEKDIEMRVLGTDEKVKMKRRRKEKRS